MNPLLQRLVIMVIVSRLDIRKPRWIPLRSKKSIDERRIPGAETCHRLFEQFGVSPNTIAIALGFDSMKDEEEGGFEVRRAARGTWSAPRCRIDG